MIRLTIEDELALRAGTGDNRAFDELAAVMAGLLVHCASQFFGPGLEHDDLVQEAWIGLWHACRTYNPDVCGSKSDFVPFALLCIRRKLTTAIVTARRAKHGPLDDALSLDDVPHDTEGIESFHEAYASQEHDPLDRLLQREQLDTVVSVFNEKLTVLERDVAVGLMNGESYGELGRRLGFPVYERGTTLQHCKTVDNALQRGRRKVLAALADLEEAA